jgi:hypothetical protein
MDEHPGEGSAATRFGSRVTAALQFQTFASSLVALLRQLNTRSLEVSKACCISILHMLTNNEG